MNWLNRLKVSINKFMYGRYGVDEFSMVLIAVSLIIMVITGWLPGPLKVLSLIAYIPMIIYIFRTFSKNIFNRQKEYYKYLSFKKSALSKLKKYERRIKDSKTHKYFKCPNCHQELRVPRGNGKITIKCPKCHTSFKGKS